MSGYKPASTMVFFNTTAEEWGYTDCNYDWLVGSVYSIQHTHPDWAGKVKAMLNLELLGYKKGSTWFTATRELKPWLKAEMKKHPKLVGPKGGKVLHAEPEPLVQLQRPVGAHGDGHPVGVHVDARRVLLVATTTTPTTTR